MKAQWSVVLVYHPTPKSPMQHCNRFRVVDKVSEVAPNMMSEVGSVTATVPAEVTKATVLADVDGENTPVVMSMAWHSAVISAGHDF